MKGQALWNAADRGIRQEFAGQVGQAKRAEIDVIAATVVFRVAEDAAADLKQVRQERQAALLATREVSLELRQLHAPPSSGRQRRATYRKVVAKNSGLSYPQTPILEGPPKNLSVLSAQARLNLIQSLQLQAGNLGDISTQQQSAVQQLALRQANAYETISNMMKSFSDTAQEIIANLK